MSEELEFNSLTYDEQHLIRKLRNPDFIKLRTIAAKYERNADFYMQDREAYNDASSKGWLNEICQHMVKK